ncbi:histidine phosphatase family protein [Pedobacter aquatilis]|uniref:histidine phosphatase family protein n=1 Tax=Pedobacter aquatilis TaxID=351343 RepID=UPI00292E364B|nr:histidine phosphatase family protein [Pedobacter aquatilis]
MNTPDKKFYYLRHHRTQAHEEERICGGGSDLPLNQSAVEDLKANAHLINEKLAEVKVIYTTPLLRARQTAELINGQAHKDIQILAQLAEWHLGSWERQPWSDLPHPFTFEGTPPDGESRQAFRERVNQAIDDLLERDEVFAIVGHGIFFHELSAHLLTQAQYIETAELISMSLHEGKWTFSRIPYKDKP